MVATTNCRPAETRPPIAAPCLWEDDEVDGRFIEHMRDAFEALAQARSMEEAGAR
jgi:hypothetical protein